MQTRLNLSECSWVWILCEDYAITSPRVKKKFSKCRFLREDGSPCSALNRLKDVDRVRFETMVDNEVKTVKRKA